MLDRLPPTFTNVSGPERWASAAVGGLLTVFGFDGRGPTPLSVLTGGFLVYRGATGHCPVSQALGVSTADATAPHSAIAAGHGVRVDETVAVGVSPREAYRFWRDFENLPRFMEHLADVDTTTDGRSRWTARGPLGATLTWDAQLVTDNPDRTIAWRSLPGSDVDTAGSVHFAPRADGGTDVRVELKYDPPAGKVGAAVAWLFGASAARMIRADLARFKDAIEGPKTPQVVAGG
jgi:uncharacterized membrane protein